MLSREGNPSAENIPTKHTSVHLVLRVHLAYMLCLTSATKFQKRQNTITEAKVQYASQEPTFYKLCVLGATLAVQSFAYRRNFSPLAIRSHRRSIPILRGWRRCARLRVESIVRLPLRMRRMILLVMHRNSIDASHKHWFRGCCECFFRTPPPQKT